MTTQKLTAATTVVTQTSRGWVGVHATNTGSAHTF